MKNILVIVCLAVSISAKAEQPQTTAPKMFHIGVFAGCSDALVITNPTLPQQPLMKACEQYVKSLSSFSKLPTVEQHDILFNIHEYIDSQPKQKTKPVDSNIQMM